MNGKLTDNGTLICDGCGSWREVRLVKGEFRVCAGCRDKVIEGQVQYQDKANRWFLPDGRRTVFGLKLLEHK